MSGDNSSLSLRAPAQETVFRPFPLASPSGALYIERMIFLRPCINQSIHYLRLYRSLYSNTLSGSIICQREKPSHAYSISFLSLSLVKTLKGTVIRQTLPDYKYTKMK